MPALLYAAALSFTASKIRFKSSLARLAASAVILIMMCDIGYVSYFNSLYGEGFQHILFVAMLGFILGAIRRAPKICEIVIFTMLLLLYGLCKFFNIPIAVLLGASFVLLSLKHNLGKKLSIATVSSFALSAVCLICAITLLPSWISKQTNYNSVFHGISKDCTDSEAIEYLDDLGLDSELYVLKNTHSYVSDFDEIKKRV